MADGQGFGPSLAAFDWADPFRLADQLTEDERMVADSARAYAQDKLQPRVRAAYREETCRARNLPRDGRYGPPRRYDPRGIRRARCGLCHLRLVAREIERVDSGYRSMMSVQSSLVMYPIHAYGSEAQKRKYLPEACGRQSSSAALA